MYIRAKGLTFTYPIGEVPQPCTGFTDKAGRGQIVSMNSDWPSHSTVWSVLCRVESGGIFSTADLFFSPSFTIWDPEGLMREYKKYIFCFKINPTTTELLLQYLLYAVHCSRSFYLLSLFP